MIVRVRWSTHYGYSTPVELLHTELRVEPVDRPGSQRVIESQLLTSPLATIAAHRDAFGNRVAHLDFLKPVSALEVGLAADVETSTTAEPATRLSPLLARLYVQPTPRAPLDESFDAFAPTVAHTGPLDFARALNQHLHEQFVYEVGSSDVDHTARDFARSRRGVCQDFAHLMLAILRRRGWAARYVSGYLAGADESVEANASHAWVQILHNDAWWGLDPANGAEQDERYVVAAVGRDYDDVPPLRGTYIGAASESWSTRLEVASSTQQ